METGLKIKEIRTIVEQKKGQRDLVTTNISSLIDKSSLLKKEIKYSEKAQALIQAVAKETQAQLEYHISDIVTLALDTIFDKPYKFKVEFTTRRNKTECDLLFERNGKYIKPMGGAGGGVIDTASFALRIALWTLKTPKSRSTIILDEPFKHLHKSLLPRACDLLQELRNKLNLQFIIVTHLDELAECADKPFEVRLKKNVSKVS